MRFEIKKIRDHELSLHIHNYVDFFNLQLEDHEKALKILVHKLRDYGAAENYCLVNSEGRESNYRKRLFHILLSVYLDPANE